MNGRHHFRREFRFKDSSSITRHPKRRAEDGLGRGRAKADEEPRPDDSQLRLKPRATGRDLARVRLFMNSAFATRLPFEVLHGIRHIDFAAIDSRVFESAVEDLASGADEGFPREIFLVARLFAQQHERRAFRSSAEDGLSGVAEKMAGGAGLRRFLQGRQTRRLRCRRGLPVAFNNFRSHNNCSPLPLLARVIFPRQGRLSEASDFISASVPSTELVGRVGKASLPVKFAGLSDDFLL